MPIQQSSHTKYHLGNCSHSSTHQSKNQMAAEPPILEPMQKSKQVLPIWSYLY